MEEKIQGERKIDVAVRSFNQMIDDLAKLNSEELYVDLRIFGHNIDYTVGANSCKDTVLEIPLAKLDPQQMKNKIASIVPKGLTPLAISIEQAGFDFPR